jgi:hypothetical protein
MAWCWCKGTERGPHNVSKKNLEKRKMKITTTVILLFFTTYFANGQSIDESFTQKKMKQDFEIFKQISKDANSGLY